MDWLTDMRPVMVALRLALAGLVGYLAHRKRRSWIGWSLAAAVGSVFVLALVIMLPAIPEPKRPAWMPKREE